MKWFRRGKGQASPWRITSFSGKPLYPLPGGALLGVAGERHHLQAVVQTLRNGSSQCPSGLDSRAEEIAEEEFGSLRWFSAELIPAPDNPYDRNAIEVRSSSGLLGFIDREHAREFRPVFDLLRERGYDGAVVSAFGRPTENQIVLCLSIAGICEDHLHRSSA